jgi:hypothetical protein
MRMLNTFPGWLFNLLLWGGIVAIAGLLYHTFVSPILHESMVALVALAVIAVLSLFWPKL